LAGGSEKALKGRIKSVESTKKITRAMEMIAASRIVKAQQRVAAARPYSELLTEVIRNLAKAGAGGDHPLLSEREEVRTVGYIVITADRGLAGGYNTGVIRATERDLAAEREKGRDYCLILCGKKAVSYFRYKGYEIDETFTGISENPSYEDARAVAGEVMRRFMDEEVDVWKLVFTQFLSVGSQKVVVRRFAPLAAEAIVEGGDDEGGMSASYEFEPSPEAILEWLLPKYLEARLFEAMLEAAASEHAARQRAMKSATDNAEELIKNLSRVMNRARQETITTEIMEIVGGAEALSNG
jgi:F-type H+-transporting ATPase subunit gamma